MFCQFYTIVTDQFVLALGAQAHFISNSKAILSGRNVY